LFTTLVRPKLEHASVAWNCITLTDSSEEFKENLLPYAIVNFL
jgi:hypothetical protein